MTEQTEGNQAAREPTAPTEVPFLNCRRCGFELIKPTDDGRVVVRVKVFFIKNHILTVRCKICGHDSDVKLA